MPSPLRASFAAVHTAGSGGSIGLTLFSFLSNKRENCGQSINIRRVLTTADVPVWRRRPHLSALSRESNGVSAAIFLGENLWNQECLHSMWSDHRSSSSKQDCMDWKQGRNLMNALAEKLRAVTLPEISSTSRSFSRSIDHRYGGIPP
eukprot:sb/3473675/